MNILLLAVGKTDDHALSQLIEVYESRLKHYVNFEFEIIPDLKKTKSLSTDQQKEKEGALILSRINTSDFVILLDERGREFSSKKFATYIQKRMNTGLKRLVFVIGGPYGFSQDVYTQSHSKLALSQMTFSHQMVRLFFIEQLYRAFTILRNEPYHHQ